jgi:CubicO group peptidase (beta-lactamase class C family)
MQNAPTAPHLPVLLSTKKMKSLFQFRFIILIFILHANIVLQAQQPHNIDSIISNLSMRSQGAGISICVVRKDSVLYAKTFGYRDLEKQLPVTENTVFPVGSSTKSFTAAMIGILGNKIKLDAPAHHYLPQLKFYTKTMTEQVTVRDLLCHRSGLPRHEYSWFLLASLNRDTMLKRVAFLEPNFRVAEKWQYSNFGYFLLGMLEEAVTGGSYETAIEQYLLQPLQMKQTYFSYERLLKEPDRATGYKKTNDGIKQVAYHPLLAMAPAGGLNSTAKDLGRWVSAWISDNKIIPQDYKKQAISSQVVTKAALPSGEAGTHFSNYGFGWFLTSYRGHYRVEHGGNIDGFTTTTCFFPADSIGIVVLCNRENSLLPAMIRNRLSDHFLNILSDVHNEPQQPIVAATENKTADKIPKNTDLSNNKTGVTKPAHALVSYTGAYTHPGYGTIDVQVKNDSLFATLGTYHWWLRPELDDKFLGMDVGGEIRMAVEFAMDEHHSIKSMSIPFEPTVSPIVFSKQTVSSIIQPVPGKQN